MLRRSECEGPILRDGRLAIGAVGDSMIEGIADVVTNDPITPWSGYLAGALAAAGLEVDTVSAARRGATARDGLLRQLPEVLAAQPQLAVVWLGLNDVLRPTFAADTVASTIDEVVSALTAQGALVLTARMPLPDGAMMGGPVRLLAGRVQAVNEAVDGVASARSTLHLDVGRVVADLGYPAAFGVDGVHFSPLGHWAVARAYLGLLGEDGLAAPPVPRPRWAPIGAGRRAAWLATHGVVWAVHRPADVFRGWRA